MKKTTMLLRAALRRQRGSAIGILLLMFILSLCLFSAVTLYTGGQASVTFEMDRLGFGDITFWVNGHAEVLQSELEALPEVEKVSVQPLVFAGYQINGTYSDNEGQMLVYDGSVPYRFIDGNGAPLSEPVIAPGTLYLSPALRSTFHVNVGDMVHVELSRGASTQDFVVAGYFEDAFMGSSMIDMKSFLISSEDDETMRAILASAADYDVLGKTGAMLHVTQSADSRLSDAEFQRALMDGTSIGQSTEFSYSRASILSYMLLLQNILAGFLLAFSLVLLVICLLVISHSLSAVIEQSGHDIAVMKTIGMTGGAIRSIYLALYGGSAVLGLGAGLLLSGMVSRAIAAGMLTSTGLLISVQPPVTIIAGSLALLMIGLALFLWLRTARILAIPPIQSMRENRGGKVIHSPLHKKTLCMDMAVREVLAGKRRYAGLCLIAMLLVVFLSVIGKMGAWLGPVGEGLMNAFSVADHDLGVQPLNETIDMDAIEAEITAYSPIMERYELAMQSVSVGGQEYTANVLDDTAHFHMLEGAVCGENEVLITYTVAGEQGLSIGDTVEVASGGRRASYTVSGIYQCANGMGSNIGMSREGYAKIGNVNGFIWCRHYLLEDGSVRDALMQHLQDSHRGIDVHTNAWSGLDGIVTLMHTLIGVIYGIAALFILIAVTLAAGKLLQSETGNLSIYQSIGVSTGRLRLAFALRFLLVVLTGAVLGALISAGTADALIGRIFRMFGIGAFVSRASLLGTVLPPAAVSALFFGFAWLSSAKIAKVSLVKSLSENDE